MKQLTREIKYKLLLLFNFQLGNHQTITSELIQSSLDSTHLPSIFTDCPPRISLELIEDASCCKITSLQQSVRQLVSWLEH